MKTKENLNMSDIDNFSKDVVSFIRDNRPFIEGHAPGELARAALNLYNATVEGYEQQDEFLSEEQKGIFLSVAKRYFFAE